jgi:hypothetical protein
MDDGATFNSPTGVIVGKYIFAWILGIPAVVLVGIYLVAHL